ncbi:MAG: lipoprotein [Rhodospirillales bacterium]|tara:strand:- start:4693 stop:4932 length:240 start_codon:yes stop_codon:yes gene_type:complete
MKRPILLAAALIAVSSLSACGLTGDLKRPAPLWGNPDEALEPADLPDQAKSDLPPLPERESTAPADNADDELLGGTDGN